MLHHGLRSAWRTGLDYSGSQTVSLKCDNESAILALAQKIRRLRREGSITIMEHPEEEEKQSKHLAEGSVNVVKGLIRTLKSSTESNLRTEIGPSHPLIPWIMEHAAQLKNRYIVGADGRTPTERLRGRGVQRLVCEPDEETLAQGSTMGLEHPEESHQMQDVATAQCA